MKKRDLFLAIFLEGVFLFCTILMLVVAYMRISDLEDRVYKLENPGAQPVEFESMLIDEWDEIN